VRVLADGKFAGYEDVWAEVYLYLSQIMLLILATLKKNYKTEMSCNFPMPENPTHTFFFCMRDGDTFWSDNCQNFYYYFEPISGFIFI
jgi:hypothetical protein